MAASDPMDKLTGSEEKDVKGGPGLSPLPIPIPGLTPSTSPASPITALNQIIQGLGNITVADIENAITIAKAGSDTVALNGFQALLTLIQSMQAADTATTDSSVHLVTDFAKIRLVALALRPGSAFNTAFAPLANEVKQDVMTAVAAIAGGTLTLASFGL